MDKKRPSPHRPLPEEVIRGVKRIGYAYYIGSRTGRCRECGEPTDMVEARRDDRGFVKLKRLCPGCQKQSFIDSY